MFSLKIKIIKFSRTTLPVCGNAPFFINTVILIYPLIWDHEKKRKKSSIYWYLTAEMRLYFDLIYAFCNLLQVFAGIIVARPDLCQQNVTSYHHAFSCAYICIRFPFYNDCIIKLFTDNIQVFLFQNPFYSFYYKSLYFILKLIYHMITGFCTFMHFISFFC